MNKQQLAQKIWESANKMRSKIEANEYKDYILGFIFYKYLSENEVKLMLDNDSTLEELPGFLTEDDAETVDFVQRRIGYFISYDNLYSTWIAKGSDFSISDVRDALNAFDRLVAKNYSHIFEGIFDTLRMGLSKLGENAKSQTSAAMDLIALISDIPMDSKQDYDVLGFIYEELLKNFAANAGKKAGEFYTPHEVSVLMSEIVADHLKNRDEIKIYDPTSGSGSLLINIGNAVAKHNHNADHIRYYAQELKQNTYNLTRMNLIMRGILPGNIATRNGDTLKNDWPMFEESDPDSTYSLLPVDAVVSNPPYSQEWDTHDMESDPRFKDYGIAPKKKADYAFLLHSLYHVKPDGIMTIVLPHGVLFRGGEEEKIRRNLIENGNIDAIIGLPANIFYGTGIPTIIMVLKKNSSSDVLIVDASKGFIKEGTNNKLRASDIKRIVDVVSRRKTVDKFSRVVSKDEIRANDYNLNIPRYVDSSDEAESWDIYASMFGGVPKKEVDKLSKFWDVMPGLYGDLFAQNNEINLTLKTDKLKETILNHADANAFKDSYASALAGFDKYLEDRLLNNIQDINVPVEEMVLSDELFHRLSNVPLIDVYDAYQVLDDEWQVISTDLEAIQSEGIGALNAVDPNMVTKNKKEVQSTTIGERWVGRVLPFELVQASFLSEKMNECQSVDNEISELDSVIQNTLDSLSEDEKLEYSDLLNDDASKFSVGPLKKYAKSLRKEVKIEQLDDESIEARILEVEDALVRQTSLKKTQKQVKTELEALTKTTIETMSIEQALGLLKIKWIDTLINQLQTIPVTKLQLLVDSLISLQKKYSDTLSSIDNEIQETEKELVGLLDCLTGPDLDMEGIRAFCNLLGGE